MAGGEQGNQRHTTAERRRRIVELRDADMTFRQIAEETGLSLETVWRHYQHAMAAIPAPAVAEHAARVAALREQQLERIALEREEVLGVMAARHLTVSGGNIVRPVTGVDEEGRELYGEPLLDDGPLLAAVDRLVKLDDQEARLTGMYPKTEVSHGGSVRHEIVGVDLKDIL